MATLPSMVCPATPLAQVDDSVQAVRRFNRFYTRQIGVLQEHLLRSRFSLTEVRVLYELAQRAPRTAVELRRDLGLDRGYLSRMLRNFERHGWIKATPSRADRRRIFLSLTRRGRSVFVPLERRSSQEVATLLARLSSPEQSRLLAAMREIQEVLGESQPIPSRGLSPVRNSAKQASAGASGSQAPDGRELKLAAATDPSIRVAVGSSPEPRKVVAKDAPPLETAGRSYTLRAHRPGDMGWVVARHGELYWQEYGYDERFEALVAEIVAGFIQNFDPRRERCWIAEKAGERVGAIFLVKKSETTAKLRLLLVEPGARGLGIGKRLVSECVQFARDAGYKKVLLWTQSELHAARHLYERAGFRRINEQPHRSWGRDDLIAETWELILGNRA